MGWAIPAGVFWLIADLAPTRALAATLRPAPLAVTLTSSGLVALWSWRALRPA